jgi:hypothetical protein
MGFNSAFKGLSDGSLKFKAGNHFKFVGVGGSIIAMWILEGWNGRALVD